MVKKRILLSLVLLMLFCFLAYYAGRALGSGGGYSKTEHGGTDVNSNSTTGVYRASVDTVNHPAARSECVHCHEEHGSIEGAEPNPTGGPSDYLLMRTGDNNLCYECHTASLNRIWPGSGALNYDGSGHGSTTATYNSRDVKLCVQCHNPHGAIDTDYSSTDPCPRMTRFIEEKTCVSNGGIAGSGCHGSSGNPTGAKNIYSLFYTKTYRHPLSIALGGTTLPGTHSSTESQSAYPTGTAFYDTNRHVECVDCHNPHMARNYGVAGNSTHTPPTNVASRALLGIWGVNPTYGVTPWVAPSSYTTPWNFTTVDDTANKEYQLCFKCHSSFAYGGTPPSGYTDQSKEFNPNNASYHMVVATTPSATLYSTPVFVTTSYPWTRTSNLYCSDCHSEDTTTTALSAVKGPHGSGNPRILWGIYDGTTGDAGTQNHLCFKCHPWADYVDGSNPANDTGFSSSSGTNLHATMMGKPNVRCQSCHVKIPHGWKTRNMIFQTLVDTAPEDLPYKGVPSPDSTKVLKQVINWRASGQWSAKGDCNHTH